tara:strand:+ start:22481 stop:25960 length:3480 start_codon:yes stop_codon:yes gene_type:complete
MSKNIRIRTEPNGGDKHLKVQLTQDFDFLEILSLKISQEDAYRNFQSDYGCVVGRVIMNSGVGVPNAKVSVFIPLSDDDSENIELKSIYPYDNITVLNSDGVRYNTLPKDKEGECFTPIGTLPTKREILDNDLLLEVYDKYYKFTTTTNQSGDFMLFGIPVGNHLLNIDVDLSDIGIYSQRPYDFIEQGNPKKLFDSPTKFRGGTNLNNLTQVKNRQVGINVIPFWGEEDDSDIGISRIDVDLNYNIKPKAIFMGSIFGDNEKNSVNKNCRPRRKLGKVCEMGEGGGSIEMLRKDLYGETERFDVDGGRVIDDNGAWAYQIPMNLDYMITDEFGELIPTEDTTRGIPTRARTRFRIGMDNTGGEGRLRTRAKYLVPNNPENYNEIDYEFGDSTTDASFRDIYWNKIYTIKNFIGRFQKNDRLENRNFVGFKDVDDCVGVKNPIPFNTLDTDLNPLYIILCLIITIIVEIVCILNKIISVRVRPFGRFLCFIGCIPMTCPVTGDVIKPCCKCGGNGSKSQLLDCIQISLAEALNVFEFDFYNDWINGSLYSFLLKYKKTKSKKEKFCGGFSENDGGNNGNLVATNLPPNGKISDSESVGIVGEGIVVNYKGDLYYKPITKTKERMYATDIYELGAVFDCDWQSKSNVQEELVGTSYKLPALLDDGSTATAIEPLLFDINCVRIKANTPQSRSIRRICEIGVDIDDETEDSNGNTIDANERIDNEDINDELVRRKLIKLNTPLLLDTPIGEISALFDGDEYEAYRDYITTSGGFKQPYGNSMFFYFGTIPNSTALDLMNGKYFTSCFRKQNNTLVVNGEVSDVTTVEGVDGVINIAVQGGLPPYQYNWSNGQITENLSGLTSGTYTVTVTDTNEPANATTKTFIVSGLQDLQASLDTKNASSPSSENGAVYVSPIVGGIGPYQVTITGPIDNPTINSTIITNDVPYSYTLNNVFPGTFNVSILDSNTPQDSWASATTVNTPAPMVITKLLEEQANCTEADDAKLVFKIVGGTPEYAITLRNLSVIDPNTGNPTIIFNGGSDVISPDLYPTEFVNFNGYEFLDLAPGNYELKVEDSYTLTHTDSSILFSEPAQLELIWNGAFFLNSLVLNNTIIGVSYGLYKDGILQTTVIATSDSINFGFVVTGSYVGTSEFGCNSNVEVV